MINIKICDVSPLGGCSYYRGIGVLSKLRHLNEKINVSYAENISWPALSDADILFLVRPVEENYIDAIKTAKDFGIKTWVDFDDCLHEIPESNPSYDYYRKQRRNGEKLPIDRMIEAIGLADIVTVSTESIKKYYSKYKKDIIVIENAFNDYNYKFEKVRENVDFINWRGSATHRQDLLSCAQGIFTISERYDKWAWSFIGNDIWFITDRIKNKFVLKETDIINYFKFIKDLKPSIQMIPLVFDTFNECKSNIAWIESTYSGATTLCPELIEFKKPGTVNYTEKDGSFVYNFEKLLKNKSFREKRYSESFDYIKENLMLSDINKKRIEVVERLL